MTRHQRADTSSSSVDRTHPSDTGFAAPALVDAARLPDHPMTARGRRTRSRVVAAARCVFERRGYLETRVADITAAAKCSTGTFYSYFTGKEQVFQAVLAGVQDDMLHPSPAEMDNPEASPYELIEAGNRAYLLAFQRNAKLMMLLEQVATLDQGFRALRQQRSRAFVDRNARGIADLQARGLVDTGLDPHQAARALSAMVSFTAYHTFCIDQDDTSIEELVTTCTRLWANALRLETPT